MRMWELFPEKLYKEMLEGRFIRESFHPTLDLRIIKYTESAQFDHVWNDCTMACRGLIVNSENEVIARPFDKFFNLNVDALTEADLDRPVRVTDKMDGSLGILWNYKGQQGIATPGSMVSDHAFHGTKLWQEKYGFKVSECWTYLFEIIYTDNRVVVDYGDMDELVLLGVRDIESGDILAPDEVSTWRGPKTPTFPYKTLREAVEAPDRRNAEGYVIEFLDTGERVKLKQEDYKALHRLVSGLTEKRIFETLHQGGTLKDLYTVSPDEWHPWVLDVWKKYQSMYMIRLAEINAAWCWTKLALDWEYPDSGWGAKELHQRVRKTPLEHYMYAKHQKQPAKIHRSIKKEMGWYKDQQ